MVRIKRISPLERRGHSRLDLELGVYRTGSDGARVRLGTTLNVSRSGVLLRWEYPLTPAIADKLTLEMETPFAHAGSRRLCCQGKVTRVSPSGGGWLVAVMIAHMRFRAVSRKPPAKEGPEMRSRRPGVAVLPFSAGWVFIWVAGFIRVLILVSCLAAPAVAAAAEWDRLQRPAAACRAWEAPGPPGYQDRHRLPALGRHQGHELTGSRAETQEGGGWAPN